MNWPDVGHRMVVGRAGAAFNRVAEPVDAPSVAALFPPATALASLLMLAGRSAAAFSPVAASALALAGAGRSTGRPVPLVPALIWALTPARRPGRSRGIVLRLARVARFLATLVVVGVHRRRSSR